MLGLLFLLVLITAAFSFSIDFFVVVTHEYDHPSDFDPVGADVFVYFYFFFFDEVEGIVAADGKEMGYFGFIFAPTDVEDEFFFGENVGFVERAAGFLLLGNDLEHFTITTRCV
jgi:hypothetical protein